VETKQRLLQVHAEVAVPRLHRKVSTTNHVHNLTSRGNRQLLW